MTTIDPTSQGREYRVGRIRWSITVIWPISNKCNFPCRSTVVRDPPGILCLQELSFHESLVLSELSLCGCFGLFYILYICNSWKMFQRAVCVVIVLNFFVGMYDAFGGQKMSLA